MENYKDMFVNGCNMVYCENERERNDFVKKFLDENPEYAFEMRKEFMDLKKRLFGNPSAYKIVTNNGIIKKTKSNEEIIHLLKQLDIYYLADRVPRAMSLGQRMIYSMAYDMLEKDKATFLISEGGSYNKETLKGIAGHVNTYAKAGDLQWVWVTGTAHQDAEVQKLCDGLFELKNGKLIQHDVKKDIPSKFISKDRMPLPGKVCRLSDGTEGIVLNKKYGPIKNSDCYDFSIRELETGEVSKLTVMWSRRVENPTYYSFYKSSYPRAGAKASKLGDFVCWYEQETKNAEYESYEGELRYCAYLGDHLCRDLFTGETYCPELKEPIRKELEMVKKGDIVSVCLYGGKVYFGGSYRTETIVSLFASSKEGKLSHFNALHYGFFHGGQVYMEKGGIFVETSCEEEKLYILHRVCMLETENNDLYTARGIDLPLAWVTPAQGEIKYGLLKGNVDEWKCRTLTFLPFHEEDTYKVNVEIFSEESFEYLCQKAIPAKAEVFEVDYKLAIPSKKPLERHTFTYTFQDGNNAVCVDTDTYEITEIPCSDLPAEIMEGCLFDYYPEIKYFSLVERDDVGGEAEDEPMAESIITYEGFDPAKQAHVIRIVDGDGKMAEYTYGNEEIEFTEEGIEKGMRVDMRLSFNDDTCSLHAHLSKYKG